MPEYQRTTLFPEMKTKMAGTLAAMALSILAGGAVLAGVSARGCTVFCDSQGDTVLAGRSFDIPDNTNLGMLLVPATAKTHGWFSCCRFAYPWADGMNDQGLFFAVADVPFPSYNATRSKRKPADLQAFATGLLGNCASVPEAIRWAKKQPIYGWADQSSEGYYTFVSPQHMLVADRTGDSVVFEWYQGKLTTVRKRGRYQLMTNFLLSDPKAGSYPCPRYIADTIILDKAARPSLQTCRQVLETTATGLTRYSLLCDLTHGDVTVYLRRGFEQPKTIHLADELQKGRHELDLDQWFGRPKPELLSPPPVVAPSTIPAVEVLKRALAARGGEKAAAAIHSLHLKGSLDVDRPCLPALSAEYFAMRPNQSRLVADMIVAAGPNLGQYVEGFDGRTGWNIEPDGSCHILRGEEYDLRKDGAGLFGWYDDPDWYDKPGSDRTAECLGQAQFDGKLCYALKIVSPTQHENFEYYDTTNFLLAGVFGRVTIIGVSGWTKTVVGGYRAFDGFLMPTRFTTQGDTGTSSFKISSLEMNSFTNIPPALVLAHPDSETYGRYVGQYRASFLFGLLHLGPTLSISHVTDKTGDHLVASVRGVPAFGAGKNDGDFLPVKTDSFVVNPDLTRDNIQLTFIRLRNGKATRIIVKWNGRILTGGRISDTPAG
jgi:hypothetical protein